MNDLKQTILEFIRQQPLMVISTITANNQPEAAVVGVAQTDDLELIFGTSNQTRKYKNLLTNQRVACVIGWDPQAATTVQYEGIVRELEGQELEICREIHQKKIPSAARFANDPNQRYFKISPVWIRYTNFPQGIIEEVEFEKRLEK